MQQRIDLSLHHHCDGLCAIIVNGRPLSQFHCSLSIYSQYISSFSFQLNQKLPPVLSIPNNRHKALKIFDFDGLSL